MFDLVLSGLQNLSMIVYSILFYLTLYDAKNILYILVIDRYRFFITDTDYLYIYVPDNRYAEPIFIYCYEVNK